jgi:hypothetical protein
MSLLINDKLIWVSIPKNASYSIEESLINSNLKINHSSVFYSIKKINESIGSDRIPHPHVELEKLKVEFGNKETFCIKREIGDRFKASIEFIFSTIINENKHTPIIPISEIDNNFIYSFFNLENINNLFDTSLQQQKSWFQTYNKLIKEDLKFSDVYYDTYQNLGTLLPQNFFTNSKKCTYEFDISNLDEYVLFMKDKFNVNIKVKKINRSTNKNESNIENNTEFKNWVFDNFEKRFEVNNKKII